MDKHILTNKVHIYNINIVCHAVYIAFIHPFWHYFLSYNNNICHIYDNDISGNVNIPDVFSCK